MAATLPDGDWPAKAAPEGALPEPHVFGKPAAAQGTRLTQIKFPKCLVDTLKLH
jgi:hypothetical protein